MYLDNCTGPPEPIVRPESIAGFGSNVLSVLRLWRERARYRQELAMRSERELQDIGTCWASISDEVRKPFWRA